MSALSDGGNAAALAAAFGAAVLGSGHCFAMCGALAALPGRARTPAYQAGRLLGYSTVGAFAGAIGAGALRFVEDRPALQVFLLAAIVASIGIQSIAWWRGAPDRSSVARASRAFHSRAFGRIARAAARRGGAFFLGLGTALIPCGWIGSFALAAAASGSAVRGAAFFAALWLGSLPALLAAAFGFGWARDRLRRPLLRRATAIAMAAASLGAISHRWAMSLPTDGAPVGNSCDPAASR